MFRVLIADDEQAVRIGMRSFIDWKKNDFELVGEAKDGKTALTLIQQTKPDIVITDLKMPGMDGLELINALNGNNFHGKILVLSNYDEFDLVRNAMKAGASDYLLKVTMEPDELLDILKQLCEKLSSEKSILEESDKIKSELNRSREIEIKQYFVELLNGITPDIPAGLKAVKGPGISMQGYSKRLLYIVIDNFEEMKKSGRIKDINCSAQTLVTAAADTLDSSDSYIIDLNHKEFIVLFTNTDGRNISELALSVQNTIGLYLNLSVTIVLSDSFTEMHQLKARFDSCKAACEYKFYLGCGTFICENNVQLSNDISCLEEENAAVKIKEYMEANNSAAALQCFEKVIQKAEEIKIRPELLKNTINIIINQLLGLLIQYGMRDIIKLNPYKAALQEAETLKQFESRLNDALNIFSIRSQQLKYGVYKKPVAQIIKYIDEHIGKKISSSEIAKEVGMSEGYLCKTFKSETGKSLVQYVNYLKMHRAAQLLKNSEIMVKEVSDALGIDDQFYFNKMFKKYIGMSPSEYKKKVNSKSAN